MLKVLGVHFISGIFAIAVREIALTLSGGIQLGFTIAASIFMVAYYIWAGAFLKNESLHKTILLMQVLIYSAQMLHPFGETAYRFLRVVTGGSVVWNYICQPYLGTGRLAYTLTFFLTFFIFPVLIVVGRIISGKPLDFNIKKEAIDGIKILLCNLVASVFYLMVSAIKKMSDASKDSAIAYISLFVIFIILFASGIALRKLEWSKISLVIVNLSLSGVTFVLCIPKIITDVLIGGERLIDRSLKAITGREFDCFVLFIIHIIVILLGHLAGKRLIKNTSNSLL